MAYPQTPPQATTKTSPEAIPRKPEPDVTWGQGGIDDWGWAASKPVEHTGDDDRQRKP